MSLFDHEVFKWHNALRTNPLAFIPKLELMKDRFVIRTYKEQRKKDVLTIEGPKCVEDLIEFLRKQPAVEPLQWDDMLMKSARDHVRDMQKLGATGHKGQDGSSY